MTKKKKIGIIICDRYRTCAGGKCLRSMRNREGAFSIYANDELELVGYTTCNGCPGGNIEYAGNEMVKNGVEIIHFATGMLVGYPPCPYIETFQKFLENNYPVKVVLGTHPIPQNYMDKHLQLGTWDTDIWQARIAATTADHAIRLSYD